MEGSIGGKGSFFMVIFIVYLFNGEFMVLKYVIIVFDIKGCNLKLELGYFELVVIFEDNEVLWGFVFFLCFLEGVEYSCLVVIYR